jgi:quinol monooxygenase YgiN
VRAGVPGDRRAPSNRRFIQKSSHPLICVDSDRHGIESAHRTRTAVNDSNEPASADVTTMRTTAARMMLKWRVVPGEAQAITSALQTVMMRTRTERGCTGCSLNAETGSDIEIRYVANWESEPDLQRQIRSSSFSQLAQLLERGIDPPTIEFTVPSGTFGMEYAERIRRQARPH